MNGFDGLIDELPDDDLAGDAQEALDLYVPGSKPRCEEYEYLTLLQAADDGCAEGRPGPRRAARLPRLPRLPGRRAR
ncbi:MULTISPECIES: hypothetical protein [Streptomyces]|uniref:hypothetical protein n=1 Tax=Streptomyces TaxID=1883 RepID=UPI00224931CF|nr:hypothetical protein [Streptomyces sp. JHD 1]MCX2971023.1 hypothetical protein [Streptomyces sp. JHD 1]